MPTTTQSTAAITIRSVAYRDALRSTVQLPDDLGRGCFLLLTTLLRPHELFSAASVTARQLDIPETLWCSTARTIPLSGSAVHVLGPTQRSVSEALGVHPGAEVAFLARLQRGVDELLGASLEELVGMAIQALVIAAPSTPERDAVFDYAGIGALSAGSHLLNAVPAIIDQEVRAAGFEFTGAPSEREVA